MVHIAFEIGSGEYEKAKKLLVDSNIQVEKEIEWENSIKSRSVYFQESCWQPCRIHNKKLLGRKGLILLLTNITSDISNVISHVDKLY